MGIVFEGSTLSDISAFSPFSREEINSNNVSFPSSSGLGGKSEEVNSSKLKRLLDILVSSILIFLLSPLALIVGALIKVDSRGPVFFAQKRYGAGKKAFYIYKFRSMSVMESEGAFTQAFAGDPRITKVGRILRSTSIDELPQLWNVLKGDMSLVGPRPHAISMDDAFARVISNFADRHLVRPGLTGLAQVAGYRGPTEALSKIAVRVRCDRLYIKKWSIWLDLVILAKTAFALKNPNAL